MAGTEDGFHFPAALIDQLAAKGGTGKKLTLGIRPEALDIALTPTPGYIAANAHIIEPLGLHDIIDLRIGPAMVRARTRSGFVPVVGQPVWVRADPACAHFFDTDSGTSLGVAF